MLRVEQDLVLAIEPGIYRGWWNMLTSLSPANLAALMDKVNAPEAAVSLSPGKKAVGDIAVIRLSGFITQKPSVMSVLFGGTSAEMLSATIQQAMAEPSIGAVVLDVDSPGGEVFGVSEAASVIRASRGAKPFVALANPFMTSAAYWLGSQADEVVALPSAIIGSIGVHVAHVDESKAIAAAGLNVTEITYGRRKAELSSAAPLSDEAREAIQARVDYYGEMFTADVAKGRKVPVSQVKTRFGEGGVFTSKDAQAAGMVDRIGTLDHVVGELASGKRPALRAAYDPVEMAALAALAGLPPMKVE
jgi:signal peptide peptidase SppA